MNILSPTPTPSPTSPPSRSDLTVLIGPTRPDKIELEKGLIRWAVSSHWLDDTHTAPAYAGQLPTTWKLGNRPNLAQMHAAAAKDISDGTVSARLLDEISSVKTLKTEAAAKTKIKQEDADGAWPNGEGEWRCARGLSIAQFRPATARPIAHRSSVINIQSRHCHISPIA